MLSTLKNIFRRVNGRLMADALRVNSRPYVLAPGGALIVAPHADDETLGCGGLIAAKRQAGHAVQVVFVTDSAASHPGHPAFPPGTLARARHAEALAALAVLGVAPEDAQFLDFADGSLDRLRPDEVASLTARLADLIRRFRPAEVFTTYRDDGSSEHAAVFRCTQAALAVAGGGVLLEYPVWAWWKPSRLQPRLSHRDLNHTLVLGPLRRVKARALACHRTQTEPTPPSHEPVLPRAIASATCGPAEFFFQSRVAPGAPQA